MPEITDHLYQFHKVGGHEIIFFIVNQITDTTSYYQYESVNGYWYMMKQVRTDNVVVTTYTRPVDIAAVSISVGWAGRTGLTYGLPNVVFGEE